MQRRKMLAALGSVAIGGATAVSTGAFTSAEVNRQVDVQVAADDEAYVGLDNSGDPNDQYFDATGDEFSVDFGQTEDDDGNVLGTGVNPNANTVAKSVFTIENQGTQEVDVTLEGGGDISIQDQSTEVSAPDNDGINVSLDDGANDATLGTGESIDVDFAINSGTSDLSGGLTINADTT